MATKRVWWAAGASVAVAVAVVAAGFYGGWWEQPASVPVLRVGYLPITHALLPHIAEVENRFTKVDVVMVRFQSWPDLADALKAGQIDAGGSILNTLAIKLASQGVPLKSVLMAVRDGSVLIVSHEVQNVTDLAGRTVAVPSRLSPHYILLYKYLEANGLVLGTDVQYVELAPPDMIPALVAGSIDGYIVAEPFGAQAELLGIGHVLVLSKDIEIPGSTSNECVIAIRSEFIEAYPEAVQDFVNQLVWAADLAETDPNRAVKDAGHYLAQNATVLYRALEDPENRTSFADLYPRESEYAAYQDIMLELGLLDAPIDIASFVDESYAAVAYQAIGVSIPPN